jgi:hypothetical protein
MLKELPEVINSFSFGSQMTVSSLVREMKLDKFDFGNLVTKLSSVRLNTNYSPSAFEQFSVLNREFFIDMFRDADLRMKSYYSTANLISIMLNSMTDVLFSEIEKVEKDLDQMSMFINNYEFLSGKDDLYNINYIEKFNTNINDYRFDGYTFTLPDRDGQAFDENGNGYVDKKIGIFKIGKYNNFVNIINLVSDIRVETNYGNYVTTDTGFFNSLNENKSDSWTVTVKSPIILNTEIPSIDKYITYDQSYITGAKTLVEISLSFPRLMDSIQITPGHGNGLQLMQVVLFSETKSETSYLPPSEDTSELDIMAVPRFASKFSAKNLTAVPLLSSPRLVDSTTEITFDRHFLNKVIMIFNQPIYSKNEKTVSTTELTGKALSRIAKQIKEDKKDNPDILQDMVYNLFLKNNSIKQLFKNNYFNQSYYSFKYPYIKNNFLNKNYRKEYAKENVSFGSLDKRWSTILTSVFQNFLIHSIKDKGEYFEDVTYIDSNVESRSVYSFKNAGILPEKSSNSVNPVRSQSITPETVSRSSREIIKDLLSIETIDQYEYSFSIKSIDFLSTIDIESNKACFVSKKVSLNGHPLAVKCFIQEQNNKINLDMYNYDLKVPISYEISISNVDVPANEADWIPIVSYANDKIDSEVLFFDENSLFAKTRFSFIRETFEMYENGYLVPISEYYIKDEKIFLTSLNPYSIYVCRYRINLSLYSYDNIDLIKSNLVKESSSPFSDSNGLGEKFSSTDYLAKVVLKNIPYIKSEFTKDALYNPNFGTIFSDQYQGYSPVKILMSDGTYAINLTNYTSEKYMASFPNSSGYFFIQNGKEIVFNQIVTTPFVVYYDYTNDSLRFRIILRKNISDIQYGGSIDSLLLKVKTRQYDFYYDKLNKVLIKE